MAILKNSKIKVSTPAFKAIKKIAKKDRILFYGRNDKICARKISADVKNPKTVIQQANRRGFRRTQILASKLLKLVVHPIWDLYAKSLKHSLKKFSGYTMFISINKQFITTDTTDYESLIISVGSVPKNASANVAIDGERYCISWKNQTTSSGYDNDIVKIIAFDEEFENVYHLPDEKVRRKDCKCFMLVPEDDKRIHFYIFFEGVDNGGKSMHKYSESVYVKQVF